MKTILLYFAALILFSNTCYAKYPLRLGTNVWPGYEPLYLAKAMGEVSPKAIRLIEYPSASEVIRAFRNKSIEMAALTLDEALVIRQSGLNIRIILVMDISNGGDVLLSQKNISTFQQLRGKRVGVEASALGAYFLSRALEINQMTTADIVIVNREISLHVTAFNNKEIDAVATFEPVRTILMKNGANELFSSRELPGEIVDVLIVHEEILNQRKDDIKKLIEGWFAATDLIKFNPNKAVKTIALRLKLESHDVIESYNGLKLPSIQENHLMLGGSEPSLYKTIEKLKNTMVKNRILKENVDIQNIINHTALPKQ